MACLCHTSLGLADPRRAPINFIKTITDAVKKFEKVPNRREMIHDSMYEHMLVLYEKYYTKDPDCLLVSLCEWMFLGRYTGFRREEWCNEKSTEYTRITDPLWVGNATRSVAIEDFTFFDAKGAPIKIPKSLWCKPLPTLPSDISFVELCIRKQKNNDNFQKITYSRCVKNPFLCPVYVSFRIHCRGLRLGAPPTYPAAIYWDKPTTTYKLITSRQANDFLRQTASSTFDIRPDCKSLAKWSCHSIRVTAANCSTEPSSRTLTSRTASAGAATPSLCTSVIHSILPRTTPVPWPLTSPQPLRMKPAPLKRMNSSLLLQHRVQNFQLKQNYSIAPRLFQFPILVEYPVFLFSFSLF